MKIRVAMISAVERADDSRVLRVARALADAECLVYVIACKARHTMQGNGVEVVEVGEPPPPLNLAGIQAIKSVRGLAGRAWRLMKAGTALWRLRGAEVYWCHEPDSWLVGVMVSRWTGARVVVDLHEVYWDRVGWLPPALRNLGTKAIWCLMRVLTRRTHTLVHVSRGRMRIHKRLGGSHVLVANVPARVTPEVNSIAPAIFRDRLCVVHAGPLREDYGAHSLVKAFHTVAREDQRALLVVLGGILIDGDTQVLFSKLRDVGGAVVLPHVPHEHVRAMLPHCNIGISLITGKSIGHRFAVPRKIYEYIHAGLPVVASRSPDCRRLFREPYATGVEVDPNNPEDIAMGISRLLNDRAFRSRCAQGAAWHARTLSWDKEKPKLAGIVRE